MHYELGLNCSMMKRSCSRQHTSDAARHADARAVRQHDAYPDEPVLGLEGLCALHVIVDQTEAGALSTTELHDA